MTKSGIGTGDEPFQKGDAGSAERNVRSRKGNRRGLAPRREHPLMGGVSGEAWVNRETRIKTVAGSQQPSLRTNRPGIGQPK